MNLLPYRIFLFLTFLFCISTDTLFAQHIKVPKGFYRIDQLDKACQEAAKRKTGLAFVITRLQDINDTTKKRTKTLFNLVRKEMIPVVIDVDLESDWYKKVSPIVRGAISHAKMGKFVPKLLITSPDQDEIWDYLASRQITESTNIRTVRKNIELIRAGKKKIPNQKIFDQYWGKKGTKSNYWLGRFQKIENGKIFLTMLDGAKFEHDLDTLNPVALKFAHFLAEKGKEKPNYPVESWTSNNGKKLKATFVSLKDGNLTLKLEDSALSTLPLKRLSKQSIARAKELAAKSK